MSGVLKYSSKVLRNNTLLSGLISAWRFENNLVDSVNAFNGTGINVTYEAGKVGQAVKLIGSTSSIRNIGTTSTYSFVHTTGVFSVNLWVKPTDLVHEGGLVNNNAGSAARGFLIDKVGSNLLVVIYQNSNSAFVILKNTAGFFTDTNWCMVTVVGTGTHLLIYKNGVLNSTTAYTLAFPVGASPYTLALGGFPDTTLYRLNGLLDAVLIYNRAINVSEVTQLYNSGNGLAYPYSGLQKMLKY